MAFTGLMTGIIIRGVGGFYYVKADEKVYECKARGLFRKEGLTPLPGDRVLFTPMIEDKDSGFVESIEPRKTRLQRPAVSNVDQLAIVISIKSPEPDLLLLDKLIIIAKTENIEPFICINKIDLDKEESYQKIVESYSKTNYPVIAISSKNGVGMDSFKKQLSGRITVLAGQSGVGKSTILNFIFGYKALKTGEISERIERGKHTTRHTELFELPLSDYGLNNGLVLDTPGFSIVELSEIEPELLQFYYPEFENYMGQCKFRSCKHIAEPGCKIKEMVELKEIDLGRYQRYVQLHQILEEHKEY